ncbi:8113_t:CDS:1, partial [Gigaspora margarita]
MPIANIYISKGSKIIHRWYIYSIPYKITIRDFFVKLTTREISLKCNINILDSEIIKRIEISQIQKVTTIQ